MRGCWSAPIAQWYGADTVCVALAGGPQFDTHTHTHADTQKRALPGWWLPQTGRGVVIYNWHVDLIIGSFSRTPRAERSRYRRSLLRCDAVFAAPISLQRLALPALRRERPARESGSRAGLGRAGLVLVGRTMPC